MFLILLCAAYYLALDWSYNNVESVLFGGLGLGYEPLARQTWLVGFLMALTPAFWLPVSLERPSQVCYWILYLCLVAPAMFVPYQVLARQPDETFPLAASIWGMFALLGLSHRCTLFRIRAPRVHPTLVYAALVLGSLFLCGMIIFLSGGFRLNMNLDSVYDRRLDARDMVTSGSAVAYGMSWLSSSIAPILIATGYLRRSLPLLGAGCFGALCLFSFAGTKTDLFCPLFLLALFCIVRYWGNTFGLVLVGASTSLVVISVLGFLVFDISFLSTYLVRRQFFVPALLSSYYWDFFSDHPRLYYSQGVLRWLISSPYDVPMARLIGDVYYHSLDNHANANIWASAFANGGYPGIALVTLALGLLFRVIDSLAARSDWLLVATMCGMFGVTWTNGALETSLLSNGVALSLAIFYFLPGSNPACPVGFLCCGSVPAYRETSLAASGDPRHARFEIIS
jgi:hypothetical protein